MYPNPTPTILIVDDDEWMRMMVKRMMEKENYYVIEATNGQECLQSFEEHFPDIILLDAMMPIMDGFTACSELQKLPDGDRTPILMVTALDDESSVDRAFAAGASDYLTKPIHWPVLRQRVRRLLKAKQADERLQQKIEQLDILHRIDRELGYTLNLKRVLDLTMDTAMRWSGASACVIGWVEEDTQRLEPLASLGKQTLLTEPLHKNLIEQISPFLAKMFESNEPVYHRPINEHRTELVLRLITQGKSGGFIGLEGVPAFLYEDESNIKFLTHLGSRTAAAIEKTRTFDRTKTYADRINRLYDVSTAIASHLDRDAVIDLLTRGFTVLLNGTSSIFWAYHPLNRILTIANTYVIENMHDTLPLVGSQMAFDGSRALRLQDTPIQYGKNYYDYELFGEWEHTFQETYKVHSTLIIPVVHEDTLLGIVTVFESRYDRYFLPDEIALVRSLSAHGGVALQHAILFNNIQELEAIKTEMIRMASHDLKNPLGQVSVYFDMMIKSIGLDSLSPSNQRYVERIKKAIGTIETLLADILNLEQVESQATSAWQPINVRRVLGEVIEDLQDQAEFKKQLLSRDLKATYDIVVGSASQLRQAMINLINNAIKYTPEGGQVKIRTYNDTDSRFYFEVKDTGFGIPKDRQAQIFERFYRAQAPGTEHIGGSGLGLSLVKSVIERHGGEIWFESEEGEGSTFSFWLPTHQ